MAIHNSLRPGTSASSAAAGLGTGTGTGTATRTTAIPYLSVSPRSISSKTSNKRPSTAPHAGPSTTHRRLSEDPDFEDLIMRGDTLKMTLTPSRFRQSSKDGSVGSVYGSPRKTHGASSTSASLSNGTRKQQGTVRARGYSNSDTTSKDSPSSSSPSLNVVPGHSSSSSPFASTTRSPIKLKARSATATRNLLLLGGGDDETETSSAAEHEGDEDDAAEQLNLDSEDEAILSPAERKRLQVKLNAKKGGGSTVTGKTVKSKESLFDILNSSPPWEQDADEQVLPRGGAGGSSKADRMMGLKGGKSHGASSQNSTSVNSGGLQAAPLIRPPKAFAPIANLDMLASIGPPSPVDAVTPSSLATPPISGQSLDTRSIRSRTTAMSDNASTAYATPSIADNRSLLTSMDGQSDFFSSKASFALTRKEFPLPPSAAASNNITSPNRLNSYKSTPDFMSPNTSKGDLLSAGNGPSMNMQNPQMKPMRRKMQAKDEREVDKGVNDDLMAFLRDAGPPTPPVSTSNLPTAPSQASLPLSSHTAGGSTTKNRLGSVKFRSFMRGHSKRPSTSPATSENGDATTSGFGGKFSTVAGAFTTNNNPPASITSMLLERRPSASSGPGTGNLPSVDEMGRFRSTNANAAQNFGRAIHGSLLNIGRRQSESADPNLNITTPSSTMQQQHTTGHGNKQVTTGSVPPAAYLAHSVLLQNATRSSSSPSLGTGPAASSTSVTTTLIMTGGHAASPLAKQAEKNWELAKITQRELELEEAKRKLEDERMALKLHQQCASEDAKMVSQNQIAAERYVASHPAPIAVSGVAAAQQAPYLTPEHSRDDLYHASKIQRSVSPVVNHGQALSGVDTPPTTPEAKLHSAPQFRPLQPLLEENESKTRPSTSSSVVSVSASPSAVMPGMAHKHQRRLSAVRRKPSPRVENEAGRTDEPTVSAGVATASAALLSLYDTSLYHCGREASTTSQSSDLDPAFATPATKLVEEYRGSSKANCRKAGEEHRDTCTASLVGDESARSIPATINSITSSTRLVDITNGTTTTTSVMRTTSITRSASTSHTSRPPSTVLMPLSPRYAAAALNGTGLRGADLHEILLSLRNNMISATSVNDCLEIIDAALFEVAYDTKESKTPSVIDADEEGEEAMTRSTAALVKQINAHSPSHHWKTVNKDEGTQTEAEKKDGAVVFQPATIPAQEEARNLNTSQRKARTSRYVNRVYDAIAQYYLRDPVEMAISSKSHYSLSSSNPLKLSSADMSFIGNEIDEKINAPTEESASVQRTPSLGYSASTNTESDDGMTTAADKTSSDATLVADTSSLNDQHKFSTTSKQVDLSRDVSLLESEEDEQEILQKAVDI